MDDHRQSGATPVILDNSNYSYWKVRMMAYLKAIDTRVWISVVNGYNPPMKTVNEIEVPKPLEEYDQNELNKEKWNFKALHNIFCFVGMDEFKRISNCVEAKEAWDILQRTYEGTDAVKRSKTQKLKTLYENLKMEEKESFDEFYARLQDIVNSRFALGDKLDDCDVVGKILRSLPQRFQSKVTAIEEAHNIETIKLDELVGNLQTFEANFLVSQKKSKDLAFASSHMQTNGSDDEELDSEMMGILVKKFQKVFKKHKSSNKERMDKLKMGKNSNTKGVKPQLQDQQCFECKGYGHWAQDCANKKKKKDQVVYTVSWDDSDSNEEIGDDHKDNDDGNYVAFAASHATSVDSLDSKVESSRSVQSNESVGLESSSDDDNDQDDESLQDSYNKLYEESLRLGKTNVKLVLKLKKVEKERDLLKENVFKTQSKVDDFHVFKEKLFEKLSICERERNDFIEKNVFLEKQEHDLVEVKNSLEGKIAKL